MKHKLTIKPEKSYAIYLGKHKIAEYLTRKEAEFEKANYDKSKIEKLIKKAIVLATLKEEEKHANKVQK